MSDGYFIPAQLHRTEIVVVNSRFITTIRYTPTVHDARTAIRETRSELDEMHNHVFAYRVGYGNSVIESMSDDGEPSGTAGPPVLAVLRGIDIGDTTVIVSRFFGGTKLGTGGLVRSYTEAAQEGFKALPLERKIQRRTIGVETPYRYYEQIRRMIEKYDGVSIDETFAGDITLTAKVAIEKIPLFSVEITELTAGVVQCVILD
jgi:uncharacterized YigZ family protein